MPLVIRTGHRKCSDVVFVYDTVDIMTDCPSEFLSRIGFSIPLFLDLEIYTSSFRSSRIMT